MSSVVNLSLMVRKIFTTNKTCHNNIKIYIWTDGNDVMKQDVKGRATPLRCNELKKKKQIIKNNNLITINKTTKSKRRKCNFSSKSHNLKYHPVNQLHIPITKIKHSKQFNKRYKSSENMNLSKESISHSLNDMNKSCVLENAICNILI